MTEEITEKKPRKKKEKTPDDEILVQIFLSPNDHAKLCLISKQEVRRPAHQARKFVEEALRLYYNLADSDKDCLLLLSKKLAEIGEVAAQSS